MRRLLTLPGFVQKMRPAVKARVTHLKDGGVLYTSSLIPLKQVATTHEGLFLDVAGERDNNGFAVVFITNRPRLYRWHELAHLHFRTDSDFEMPTKEGSLV